jgi:diadenylate cyclase
VDIALVAALLGSAFAWLRQTRARWALSGIAMLGAGYLLARQLGLTLTTWILQGSIVVFVIVLVVVFQEDLRRLVELIAMRGLRRRARPPTPQATDILIRSIAQLAADRTGALIVLPGREPLDRHITGGIRLDAELSEPLLLSIFDNHSPGHDGAAIVSGNRLSQFGVHLPLSTNHAQAGHGGTRHAAALGLAERTDALCLAVSEERGVTSIATDGVLRGLYRPEELAIEIHRFVERVTPRERSARVRLSALLRRWPEALGAFAAATLLWLLVVPGSGVVRAVRSVPVVVENLPEGFVLENVEPGKVEVTVSGPRRALLFGDADAIEVHVDALLVQLGRRTFQVTPDLVTHPKGFQVHEVNPEKVRLSVVKKGDS